MRQQNFLNLERRDFFSAAIDEIAGAAGEEEEAVRIEIADVAGVKPAVAKGLPGCFRVAEVTVEDRDSAYRDFSRLSRGQWLAGWVGDFELSRRPATGPTLAAGRDALARNRGGFRKPVGLKHRDAEDGFHA